MWQLLAFLAVVFLLMLAFKIAIILLVIAGLIFRTKETVGLLLVGALLNAFVYAPIITTCASVALLCIGAYLKRQEKQKADADAYQQTLRQLPSWTDGKEL